MKFDELINQNNTGIVQRIELVEKEIFDKTDEFLTQWSEKTVTSSHIKSFYKWLNEKAVDFYDLNK